MYRYRRPPPFVAMSVAFLSPTPLTTHSKADGLPRLTLNDDEEDDDKRISLTRTFEYICFPSFYFFLFFFCVCDSHGMPKILYKDPLILFLHVNCFILQFFCSFFFLFSLLFIIFSILISIATTTATATASVL